MVFPLGTCSTRELAEDLARVDGQKMAMLSGTRLDLGSIEMPFLRAVAEIGIKQFGSDIIEMEVRDSNLVTPPASKLIIAKS